MRFFDPPLKIKKIPNPVHSLEPSLRWRLMLLYSATLILWSFIAIGLSFLLAWSLAPLTHGFSWLTLLLSVPLGLIFGLDLAGRVAKKILTIYNAKS